MEGCASGKTSVANISKNIGHFKGKKLHFYRTFSGTWFFKFLLEKLYID